MTWTPRIEATPGLGKSRRMLQGIYALVLVCATTTLTLLLPFWLSFVGAASNYKSNSKTKNKDSVETDSWQYINRGFVYVRSKRLSKESVETIEADSTSVLCMFSVLKPWHSEVILGLLLNLKPIHPDRPPHLNECHSPIKLHVWFCNCKIRRMNSTLRFW